MANQISKLIVARPANEQGTTLIETMVALVVLSVGLLGIAAMQMSGLFQNRMGYERSQAVMLAEEIVEKIRVNEPAAVAGDYETGLGDAVAAPLFTCLGAGANCSTQQMAAEDLGLWKERLDDLLAGGDGAVDVTVVAGTARTVQVTVQWPPANTYTILAELN